MLVLDVREGSASWATSPHAPPYITRTLTKRSPDSSLRILFGACVRLLQIQNNPTCSSKSHIPICCMSRLQLIPDGPSGHFALALAFLLTRNTVLHCLFRRNGDRDGPDLGELVHVRGGGAGVNATLVRQPPCEACNLGIVLLPFRDLTGPRELRF